ncbi:iron-sulfur cluster carrier protein ApbC [Bermanella marisrubri]|uniref:Iron-sulfur cluster carrier protein n=1 Tax=Bermanella marisrubri TaxID=207949 RepID=Q1N6U0_9GAMM|nr:iron-sulfur cluster carrier protein ApbC [Bermanella marisrubri]EAT13502.1 ATPase involved in chromosome partitioning [Oceanobacter sp. RED65] [Bermanella marisrubri]QIZ84304.1 iron-sulfur cluster carrier protein ApbC [Bermanella marisrubri]
MSDLQGQLEQAVKGYHDPYLGSDLFEAGAVKNLSAEDGIAKLDIFLEYPSEYLKAGIEQMLQIALENIEGIDSAEVTIDWAVSSHKAHENLPNIANVKNIIAVASGKGGVGKSTTSVNLALALAEDGAKVGILDADIYGPSVGMMLGMPEGTRPETVDDKYFKPVIAKGIQSMSMAYLVTDKTPMVWRGPMVSGALQQLITQTMWDDLDYLIIDMPPGTGDIQLTLSQKVPVSASVVVTTPQDIALLDAKKGIEMFRKVNIPVLGIIENMSIHICSNCGHAEHIFGEAGAEQIAAEYNTELLGSLPLSKYIREQSDIGEPPVAHDPASEVGMMYRHCARTMAAKLSQLSSQAVPDIQITDD